MPSPNLEIFRFGFYVFFPVYVMFKVGDPEWYEKHVIPNDSWRIIGQIGRVELIEQYKEMIWPDKDEYKPPRTQADMKAELARFRAERAERKARLDGAGSPAGEALIPSATSATPVADAVATSSTGWAFRSSQGSSTTQPTERLV